MNLKTIFLTACIMLYAVMCCQAQFKTLSGKALLQTDLEAFITRKMDSLQMPGLTFTLINKGKIVYHRTAGIANVATQRKVDGNTIFEAASTSKTVFSYFVMKMVDKGLLNLDTPLYRYLPYNDIAKDDRYKLITARMVLSHQTGFPNWRYFDARDTSKYKYGELYLKFTPGTQFGYSGEGYFYLAKVIAKLNNVTIQTLDALFQSEVANPLGLEKLWFSGNRFISEHKAKGYRQGKLVNKVWPTSFPEQDSTWFGAAGGMHTESVSYAKFLIGFMKKKGLSTESKREMLKVQIALPSASTERTEFGNIGWGLGIAVKSMPYGTLYQHGGNNGNFQSGFVINDRARSGYVFFTNCDKGDALNKSLQAFLTK
ncbi:MAG: serine hydrolase domain-containing protein [Bacteroidota bacterium]